MMIFNVVGALVLASLCTVNVVQADRLAVPFSYGWRFKFGHEDGASAGGPNTCSNFEPLTSQSCTNIEHNPNRFTAEDCATGCCYEPECYLWLHNGKTCYWGSKDSVCTSGSDGSGAIRSAVTPIKTEYKTSAADFDDSAWEKLDVPYDALMTPENDFVESEDVFHGFRQRNVSWHRKHFHLLPAWKDNTVYINFDGIFHYAQLWLNGEYLGAHTAGYTSFTLRLDNATSVIFDDEKANVLAIRADATYGSGHWYEGGGIYRPTTLMVVDPVHIVQDGVFVIAEWDGSSAVPVSAELENHGAADATATVTFTLYDATGETKLGSVASSAVSVPAGSGNPANTVMATASLDVASFGVKKWSVHSPTTYVVKAEVSVSGAVVDSQTVPAGFRSVTWSTEGFSLNGELFKLRGFSHHNSFVGVGTALTQRMYLFRAQATRGLGGNIWRNSHNPYTPELYPILNALGILNWDENRDMGPWYVSEMTDMVKRDRNHPAIVVWAFCNEFECGQLSNTTGLAFRKAALAIDKSRKLAANSTPNGFIVGIDVQGLSHRNNDSFIALHKEKPDLPLVSSECCSCTSQRVDRSVPSCIRQQNSPGLLPYVAGSLGVWTLSDYFGESHSWPQVSSPYGQLDMAGFPKSHAYWYTANWLSTKDVSDPGRPPLPVTHVARVVNLGDQPSTSIETIVSTERAELIVDGKALSPQTGAAGVPMEWTPPAPQPTCDFPVPLNSVQCHGLKKTDASDATSCKAACCKETDCYIWQYADAEGCWTGEAALSSCTPSSEWVGAGISSSWNNATVVAIDASGAEVARHTVLSPGKASQLVLDVDVPSPSTLTGSALLLDGSDTAMLRVTLADANGVLVSTNDVNVTFSIVSGPGRILGSGNGDPASHSQPHSATVPTYLGLARGLAQVTMDCVTPNREVSVQVDVDANSRTKIPAASSCDTSDVVVKATAPGMMDATVSVKTSTDTTTDSPEAVARATVTGAWTYTDMQA